MKIRVDRRYKKETYTIGNLYVDGVWFCNTIEDKDRGLNQMDPLSTIKARKVYAETAIPSGRYRITLDVVSPKFSANSYYYKVCRGRMPRLLNVPGYEGILIHCGTSALDSAGCLIVGMNTVKGKVTSSRVCFERLYKKMQEANDRHETIYIDIA